MSNSLTLSNLFQNLSEIDEYSNVCIEIENLDYLDGSTKCILLSDEELEKEDITGKFSYVIGIDMIQDILENLKQQINCFTEKESIKAFNFFLTHDAFIDCNNVKN